MTRQATFAENAASADVPWYVEWMARGLLPDPLVRFGIRQRLARRLARERAGSLEARTERRRQLLTLLRESRIAIHTGAANRQHYEVPAEFFELVLGSHLKYSCALWNTENKDGKATEERSLPRNRTKAPSGPGSQDRGALKRPGTPGHATPLDHAESRMLETYCQRADLRDGQSILDLGCGWGSFSLYAAPRFPGSRFSAVSNSHGQRRFIESKMVELGITNLEVVTCDVNEFLPDRTFDRIVSVEMFEHMRNYRELLGRISNWLRPEGRLFVHIFTHRDSPYLFEPEGDDEWMARNFFTGGIMPSDDLLLHFQDDLRIVDHWWVDGRHYEQTANAWLARMDAARPRIEEIFSEVYGPTRVRLWWVNWRLFFLACSELWGFRGGSEWIVSHYLFAPRSQS